MTNNNNNNNNNNNKLELHTLTRVPEFAFGGQWGATRNQAKLNEHTSPTFGCHATTSMHIKNPDTDKLEVLVAWFGGSYEGAGRRHLDSEERRKRPGCGRNQS